MSKSVVGLALSVCLLIGCAAPQPVANSQSGAAQSAAVASVDSAPGGNEAAYDTVYVPPPAGSLLGGGYVRVPKKVSGTDERALLSSIGQLNAAAGTKDERPYVVSAVARATGVSERELQAQQDILQLRFGELCAINAIARGNSNKVQEIAGLKRKGRTWTDLAKANGVSLAAVVETTRNASDMTVSSFSNAYERKKGGQNKMKDLGVKPQVRPGT